MHVLIFEIGGLRYALPASDVREVLRAVTIVPLPHAPPIVEGIVNVRGTMVPVLDVRSRFRVAPKAAAHTDHLILACAGPRLVAVRADRALDLVQLDAADISDPARLVPDAGSVSGVATLADGIVLIHDLRMFLHEAEAATLASALTAEGV
jgi:purine-binding chemotaxis protein CheW